MSAAKWYAAKIGTEKILHYGQWKDFSAKVLGVKSVKHKSFFIKQDAEEWLTATSSIQNNISIVENSVIHIYTDGSHIKKKESSRAGWAYVALEYDGVNYQEIKRDYQFLPNGTNNSAELTAILKALENGYDKPIIFSDSQYSIDCVTKWIPGWKRNGWMTASKTPVKNADLIRAISELAEKYQCEFRHVKAHNGNYYNELVDELAKEQARFTEGKSGRWKDR